MGLREQQRRCAAVKRYSKQNTENSRVSSFVRAKDSIFKKKRLERR